MAGRERGRLRRGVAVAGEEGHHVSDLAELRPRAPGGVVQRLDRRAEEEHGCDDLPAAVHPTPQGLAVVRAEHRPRDASDGGRPDASRGHAEIEGAKADGRWDRAYPGAARAQVPDDLAAVLTASSAAASAFAGLNGRNRYAVLHRIMTAPSPSSRANRLATLVGMLERGETPYPQ
nr:YdeI/OmpD-associated family protein [Parafrankia soli]